MNRFLASELEESTPEQCLFQVVPAPFEATVSYGGGTVHGPAAILEASDQLEVWDGLSDASVLGIHTHPAVDCTGDAETVLDRIEAAVASAAEHGIPVMLGGEHTVTLGALRALHKKHGNFGIVQFDAHADLRDTYEGSPFSHACVMHRALDLGLPVFGIGVRALCKDEVALRKDRNLSYLDARDLAMNGMPENLLPADFPETIYVTFDVDGLDPSVISATGTPVPGGVLWWQAIKLLEKAIAGRTVIGMDVVELAPKEGDHASDFAAAQLTYAMMGIVQRLSNS
ncbi:agmatinase [Desulfovibrio subterraneus]|uniref:Agmatinase n=1 Tax=Desulfovibrio subterraneus TaxID=2718620 RepID=A0A7J0BH79_9BACT|nr:agmatinase [Desulfovibrio subterraneus]WBF66730.1 agmatinase [Desulfovibrio subterraneus]GFM32444.1 agmatinase [Desulfovibrio subterraneus]